MNSEFEQNLSQQVLENIHQAPSSKSEKYLSFALVLIAVAGFVGILWYLYDMSQTISEVDGDGNISVVSAPKGPSKMKPEEPGGMDVPHRDKLVFDSMDGKGDTGDDHGKVVATPEPQKTNEDGRMQATSLPENSGVDKPVTILLAESKDNKPVTKNKAEEADLKEIEALVQDATSSNAKLQSKIDNASDLSKLVTTPPVPAITAKPAEEPTVKLQEPPAATKTNTKALATKADAKKVAAAPAAVDRPMPKPMASNIVADKKPAPVTTPNNNVNLFVAKNNAAPAEVKADVAQAVPSPTTIVNPEPSPTQLLNQAESLASANESRPAPAPLAVKAATKTEVVKPAAGAYRVQIASIPDEAQAKAEAARLGKKLQALQGVGLSATKADLGAKGVTYRLQSASMDRDSAKKICDALKQEKQACLVVKP